MSDYNFLMESRLSPEQYAVITLTSRLASEQGLNLYLAGGAVRDLTYGQQVVRDLDFIVEGSPQRILRAIPTSDAAKGGRSARGTPAESPLVLDYVDYDERSNSAELIFSNGVRAELGMCREEINARPGQRPDVRPAMVFEDLKRRDFAINAMAVSLHPNSRGLLLDPTNGAGDIERHEIRALQSRTFFDDPSRIYRLLRLGMRLEFTPDERTQRWFDAAIADGAWERLDAGQQARELAAILREDQPGRVLKMLADKNLLAGLDKKLASVHLAYDRFARVRNVLQNIPAADPFLLNFHCLVEKLGSEHESRLAKLIVRDSKSIKLVLSFEQEAKKLERVLGSPKANLASQVYEILSPHPQPLLLFLLANSKSAKVQNRIKNFLFKFPQIHARLPRAELQSMGVKPGPEFDAILAQVFALELDGKIKSRTQLIKVLHELAGIEEPPPPPPVPAHPAKKGKEAAAALSHKKGKEPPVPAPQPHKAKEAATAKAPHALKPSTKAATKAAAPKPEAVAHPAAHAKSAAKHGRKKR